MIFLIDSDALIHAFRHDFPPESDSGGFWAWLEDAEKDQTIVICDKVFDELKQATDGLYLFLSKLTGIRRESTSSALPHLPQILAAYGEMNEIDLEELDKKADPYLIAHAVALRAAVVTNEVSRPGRSKPLNKQIPDVCSILHVPCIRYPRFLWDMGRV